MTNRDLLRRALAEHFNVPLEDVDVYDPERDDFEDETDTPDDYEEVR